MFNYVLLIRHFLVAKENLLVLLNSLILIIIYNFFVENIIYNYYFLLHE